MTVRPHRPVAGRNAGDAAPDRRGAHALPARTRRLPPGLPPDGREYVRRVHRAATASTAAPASRHPSPCRPAPVPMPPAPEPRAVPPLVPEPPIPQQHIPGPSPAESAAATEPVSLALLLSVVADKTGYPVDMLNGGMDLETDLGIDSIKKVEIFAAARQRAEGLPPTDSPQMAQIFEARTLDEVMRRATDDSAMPTVADTDAGEQSPPVVVRRILVRPVGAPACGLALAGLANGPITVVDGGSGLAPAVVAQLDAHGITATVGDMPERDAWGAILLSGLAPVSDPEQAGSVSRAAFQAARNVAASMEERGGVFVTVQDTGGCFGLKDPDPQRAWLGGLAALTRTAAKEWPLAAVKAIDCQRGDRSSAAVAAAIVNELLTGGCTLDVGLRADGTRWALADSESTPAPALEVPTNDSVLVVSGGARGVTAAGLLSLVSACQPRMLLIGRTALADEPEFLASARDQPALTRLLAERMRSNDAPARAGQPGSRHPRPARGARDARRSRAGWSHRALRRARHHGPRGIASRAGRRAPGMGTHHGAHTRGRSHRRQAHRGQDRRPVRPGLRDQGRGTQCPARRMRIRPAGTAVRLLVRRGALRQPWAVRLRDGERGPQSGGVCRAAAAAILPAPRARLGSVGSGHGHRVTCRTLHQPRRTAHPARRGRAGLRRRTGYGRRHGPRASRRRARA